MAGRIERVAPGAEAQAALAAEVRRVQGADPLAPVFVVVRSSIVGLFLRRCLVEGGAFAAVRFAPLTALFQQLGGAGAAAGERQPLSDVALHAAARVALFESPGLLGPVASHPATQASLVSTYRDLRWVSEAELDRLAASSTRAFDVVGLVRKVRHLLAETYYDAPRLIEVAAGRLEVEAADIELAVIGSVVVYLPDPLRPEEMKLLGALARRLDVLVLAGRTGDELADRAADRFADVLAGSFGGVAEPDGALSRPDARATSTDSIQAAAARCPGGLLSAPDDDVEVREGVRRLISHAEAGGDLGRCIVTYPDGVHSAGIGRRVADQLRAAGLTYSGGPQQLLRETPCAQLFAGLVDLAMPVPAGHELDRGKVIAWLASGPLRSGRGLTRGLSSIKANSGVPVGSWDRCSRAAGVISGIAQWRSRLRSYAARTGGPAEEPPSRRALTAEDLLELVERLHALISSAVSAKSWPALHDWSDEALEEILEPGEERMALAEALGDLDLLDGLDPLDHLPASERLHRFGLAVGVAFERAVGDRGRYGVGPVVAPLSAVAGASSDLLLVIGCREGDLPAHHPDDPLVPRSERERIEGLKARERGEETARRHLLWALSASGESQASFARVDVQAGRAVYPSLWTSELFGGSVTEVPSFAGSIARVADGAIAAADPTDFELASARSRGAPAAAAWMEMLDADFPSRLALAHRHFEGGLSPYAGYVPDAGAAPDAWAEAMSATGLETFATCPFRFFLERKLGVGKLEAPERLVVIDPLDRGALMHSVLEGFFRTIEGHDSMSRFDDEARARLAELASAQCERFENLGRTGKPLFWVSERARICRDLERYVAADIAALVAEGRVPIRVELGFGGDDHPVIAQASGRRLRFRGRIDRVDVTRDGSLAVVDYKSGKSDGYKDILGEPLGRGTHLQLPIYARAALQVLGFDGTAQRPVRAEYRFVQAAAGYAVIPVELTEDLDIELDQVLTTLVSTIDAGCFPPRPGRVAQGSQYDNCRYCDFDTLCTTDRLELWEQASTADEMRAYTDLVTGSPG